MMLLYSMLFVLLNVFAYEDHFIKNGTLGIPPEEDSASFVAIECNNEYIYNGVILTEKFVLTYGVHGEPLDFQNCRVVYGTTIFGPETGKRGEIVRKVDIDNNDFKIEIEVDNFDNNYDDESEKNILYNIVLLEVKPFISPFKQIMLPHSDEVIPSSIGRILYRVADDNSQEQRLVSRNYPVKSKLRKDKRVMYNGMLDSYFVTFYQGSPFIFNHTLYGLIIVTESNIYDQAMDPDKDYLYIANILHVLEGINKIISKP